MRLCKLKWTIVLFFSLVIFPSPFKTALAEGLKKITVVSRESIGNGKMIYLINGVATLDYAVTGDSDLKKMLDAEFVDPMRFDTDVVFGSYADGTDSLKGKLRKIERVSQTTSSE